MIRIHLIKNPNLDNFYEQWAAQLNGAYSALGVAKLMQSLVDIHHYDWDQAWEIIEHTFGYTNYTLLPEALKNGGH